MTTISEQRYTITERWLAGEHGPIRYWLSEPQQGLPVLLIHGYGALIEHWRPVMRPIARQHTLCAMDLYFFGYSARPAIRPSKELWAAQAATVIENILSGPAVVVGHSMGGIAAIQLAHDYPQLVKGLVLVNSSGMLNPDQPPSNLDQFLFSMTSAPFFGEMLANVFGNQWGARQGLRSAYYRKERVTDELVELFSKPLRQSGGASSYLAVTRSFNNFLLDVKLGAITAPSLIIWGEEDRSIPPALATLFKQRMLPQAEIQIIPESGHCPFDETPEAFCDTLLPWLAQL
jgi:pimeloyl-ACP methyl ester carboxylesterase